MTSSAFEQHAEVLRRAPLTWLVTGAAGFIGSHVTATLLQLGQRVIGLDNFSSGKRQNLTLVEREVGAERFASFRLIEGDVCNFEACVEASRGVDRIVHQAAIGSVPRSMERPLDTLRANVDGTLHVFLAALNNKVPRVVYASSSSVYGDEPTLPKVETRIGKQLSPYALSKRMDEQYAELFGRTHDLSAVGLRYFNVVGSRQDPNGPYAAVIPRWVDALVRGAQPTVYGDGQTTRDFCPVRNVVEANILAACVETDLAGRVYNIALGGQTTLMELFTLLRDGLAERGFPCAHIELVHEAFRSGDIRHSLADVSAAVRDLGYAPVHDLKSGLDQVLDSFAQSGANKS
jgi:UDP-N-acetylglucosamine/UDP-N-acetylgalactosamine 4-epimerase